MAYDRFKTQTRPKNKKMDTKIEKNRVIGRLLEVHVSIVPSGKDKRTIICVNKRKI